VAIKTLAPSTSSSFEIRFFDTVFADEQPVGISAKITVYIETKATAV
jgi:hypothetical protein